MLWEVEADGTGDLILAGNQLVAAGIGQHHCRFDFPRREARRGHCDRCRSKAQVERLLAADGKLFAVTLEGTSWPRPRRQRTDGVAAAPLTARLKSHRSTAAATARQQADIC